MAETTPPSATQSLIAQLELALAEPEPMCLAIVRVECRPDPADPADGGPRAADPAVVDAVNERLRDNLRRYDELAEFDGNAFSVVLRTLADASVLEGRLRNLFAEMTQPYVVDGSEREVRIVFGAAVRWPQENPNALLARAEAAVDTARSNAGAAPIVL